MQTFETAEEWDQESARIREAYLHSVGSAHYFGTARPEDLTNLVRELIGDRPVEAPPNVIIEGQHNISVNCWKPIEHRMVQLCLWDKRRAGFAHTRAFSEIGHPSCGWDSKELRQLIDALKDGVAYLEGTDGFKEN